MKKGISLRGRVSIVYTAVVLLIIGIFISMNLMFWNIYYMRVSHRTMLDTYTEISEIVEKGNKSDEEIKQLISTVKARSNITFALQEASEWTFMVITKETLSPYEREFLMGRLQENFLNSSSDSIKKIIDTGVNYRIQDVTLTENGSRYLECYGYMTDARGESRKFILSMPMDHMMEVTRVSTVFFLYGSLIVLILGFVVVQLLTYNITKPIYQLTSISKRMSRLDFSSRYDGNLHDEIGVLGNNMNELASQLERTILQLKMANDELQKELEEKSHVDEMRKDFISNVSHELKTPIALIQGYAEGLKDFGREDPESMDYYCDVIADEADKMNRLVKKLTKLNQLEFGSDTPEPAPFDIMDMIRNIEAGSKKMQESHQATVRILGPEHCMVLADEYQIEEVFNNYYSNAFNHLEAPNEITVSFDDLGPNVRISVMNTGQNIPEEEKDKIWIKFYKVDKARTRAYGGSGIGLSIVKAIMDAHHEECGVYNVENGVVFWFEVAKVPEEHTLEPERENSDIMNGEILGEVRHGSHNR